MLDCSHEEADTQMMVHLRHALSNGTQTIAIDSGGTDVLIILLGFYHQLKSKFSLIDIILNFALKCRISMDMLSQTVGETRCQALPIFRGLIGLNTTSAIKNTSKKKGYETLTKVYPEAEATFLSFFFNPFKDITIDFTKFAVIQRFMVLLYARTSTHKTVNDARLELYF